MFSKHNDKIHQIFGIQYKWTGEKLLNCLISLTFSNFKTYTFFNVQKSHDPRHSFVTRILIIIESDLKGFSRLIDDSIPCDCFPNNESVETAV